MMNQPIIISYHQTGHSDRICSIGNVQHFLWHWFFDALRPNSLLLPRVYLLTNYKWPHKECGGEVMEIKSQEFPLARAPFSFIPQWIWLVLDRSINYWVLYEAINKYILKIEALSVNVEALPVEIEECPVWNTLHRSPTQTPLLSLVFQDFCVLNGTFMTEHISIANIEVSDYLSYIRTDRKVHTQTTTT